MIHHATPVEDDISILSTPYFPGIEEVRAIKSRLQTRESQIHALDTRIGQLCIQRDALRQTSDVARELLTPIRRLPSETLAEIFILCIPQIYGPHFEHRSFGTNNPARVRHCLGKVCRRWRNVLQDTPRAWTALVLKYPFSEDLTILRTLLLNSKTCPLDIYVEAFGRDNVRDVISLLRGEIRRFRRFFVDTGHASQAGYVLHDLFPCGECSNAPIMEVFGVRTGHHSHDASMGEIMSPNLRTLDLSGTWFPLRSCVPSCSLSLHRLHLKLPPGSHIRAYLPFLVCCPQLETLDLNYLSGPGGQEDSSHAALPGVIVPLQSLTDLSLKICGDEAQVLLRSLRVPLLNTLHLTLHDNDIGNPFPVHGIFDDCLAEAAASLQHLTLGNVDMRGSGGAQWLARLASILSLRIDQGSCLGETFVSVLTPPHSTPSSWACPKLETVVLDHVKLPGANLVHLVRSRTQPDGEKHCPGYFKRLKVSCCSGLGPVHVRELEKICRTALRLITNDPDDHWGGVDGIFD